MNKNLPANFNIGAPDQRENERIAKRFQEEMFEYQWRKIMKRNLSGIVKKNFVKEMFPEVMKACMEKLQNNGIDPANFDISYDTLEHGRVIEQIYYYHRFYTSHLSDDERAAKQKFLDTVVPEWLKQAKENERLVERR